MNTIWLALLTGLTTGGISCLAVQGGLLTSAITNQNDSQRDYRKAGKVISINTNYKLVALFLIAKLISYTLLGLLLGYLGSFLIISLKTQAIFQLLIGLFLLGTVGRLLNLHPIFRYFTIQPPKFIYKLAKKESQHTHLLAPAFLGALTVLMPCGVTQAMMLVAIGTGNSFWAAAIMFAFVLGTSPVFFILGVTTLELLKRKAFSYLAAFVIFIFAILSINGAMALFGSPHTLQNYWKVITNRQSDNQVKSAIIDQNGIQEVTINVASNGYVSDVSTLKVNTPVKLKLTTNSVYSCARAFTIPSLNINKILPETGTVEIEFTPTKTGRLTYTCSMGMYTGSFQVIQ